MNLLAVQTCLKGFFVGFCTTLVATIHGLLFILKPTTRTQASTFVMFFPDDVSLRHPAYERPSRHGLQHLLHLSSPSVHSTATSAYILLFEERWSHCYYNFETVNWLQASNFFGKCSWKKPVCNCEGDSCNCCIMLVSSQTSPIARSRQKLV